MCFYVYLKYKFASTYLFLFLSIAIYNTMLEVLVVSLRKPVIHKLNILGGEKLEYYKINAGNHRKGEPKFEISVCVCVCVCVCGGGGGVWEKGILFLTQI